MSREALESMGVGGQLPPRSLASVETVQDEPEHWMAAERGKAAQRLGASFERALEFTHTAWEAKGLARIQRLPVDTFFAPKRIKDPLGQFRTGQIKILASRQGFDYRGELASGRSVTMEAKATGIHKTNIAIGERGIRPHQLQKLADGIRRFNALGLIVWNNGGQRLVLLPDEVVAAADRYAAGQTKSINHEIFRPYDVMGGIEDYLGRVQEWQK